MTLDERVQHAAADVRERLSAVDVPDAGSVVRRVRNRRRRRLVVVTAVLVSAVAVPIAATRPSSSMTETLAEPLPLLPQGSVTDTAWASIPKAAAGIDEFAWLSELVSTGTSMLAAGSSLDDEEWHAAIWRSSDGLRWASANHPASGRAVTAIGAHSDTLLAVGTIGSNVDVSSMFVWKSTDDGGTWSTIADRADLFGTPAREMGRPFIDSLRWSDAGFWIASGGAADGYAGVWTSRDGSSWTTAFPENDAGAVDIVETGSGDLLAYWSPFAWSSPDGRSWIPTEVSVPEPYTLRSVAAGASWAIGADPATHGIPTPLLRSTDSGRSWVIDPRLLDQYPEAVALTISRHDGLLVLAGSSAEPNRPDAWVTADADVWHALPPSLAETPGGKLGLTAAIGNRIIMMGTAPELGHYYALDTTAFDNLVAAPTGDSSSVSQSDSTIEGSEPTAEVAAVVLGDYLVDVPTRFTPTRDPVENNGGPGGGGGSFVSQLFLDDQGVGFTVSIHQGNDLVSYFGRDGDSGIAATLQDGRPVYSYEPFGSAADDPAVTGPDIPRWIEMAVDLGDDVSLWITSPELSEAETLNLLSTANARNR